MADRRFEYGVQYHEVAVAGDATGWAIDCGGMQLVAIRFIDIAGNAWTLQNNGLAVFDSAGNAVGGTLLDNVQLSIDLAATTGVKLARVTSDADETGNTATMVLRAF